MDAKDVLADTFLAFSVASVKYCVYTLGEAPALFPNENGSALRQAEVIVRKRLHGCRSNVYISLGHTGTDLWLYELEPSEETPNDVGEAGGTAGSDGGATGGATGGVASSAGSATGSAGGDVNMDNANGPVEAEPTLRLEDMGALLVQQSPGLSVSAQGVFYPPFTNTNVSLLAGDQKPLHQLGDGRYGPLLRAIELRCLDALLKNGDHSQYEAFGHQAAINTGEGSIVRLKPTISMKGVLALRMVYKMARLVPLPVNNVLSCATLVWLLPHGKPCRVLSSLSTVSAVEPPNPPRARALYRILAANFVTNISILTLEQSMWIRVSSGEAGAMLWPAVLIRATTLTSGSNDPAYSSASGNTDLAQTITRPLARLKKPDPYSALDALMKSVRSNHVDKGPTPSDPSVITNSQSHQLRHSLHSPVPPPSSPRQLSTTASQVDVHLTLREPAPAQPASVSSAYPTPAYPTPQLPTPQQLQTPFQTPSVSTVTPSGQWAPSEAQQESEEDLEVADADFNYFDLPIKAGEEHVDALHALSESHAEPFVREGTNSETKIEISSSRDKTAVPSNSVPSTAVPSNSAPSSSAPSTAVRNKQSNSMPSKLVSTGNSWQSRTRFGTLNLFSQEMDSKYSTGGRFYVAKEQCEPKNDEESDEEMKLEPKGKEEMEREMDVESESSSCSTDFIDDGDDSDIERWQSLTFQNVVSYSNEDLESGWYRSIKFEEAECYPLDPAKADSFRQLIPQIVWDFGLLEEISDTPVVRGNVRVVPQYVVERIKMVFTNLRACSIIYQMQRESAPEVVAKSPSTMFQLFSPPLVAVKRGDFRLRARISILRFWRLLGLQPSSPPPANVKLILVTIASQAVISGARQVLQQLQSSYTECNFGRIELPTFGDVNNGLLEIQADLGHTAGDAVGELYENACVQLRAQLCAQDEKVFENYKVMVLVCYPPSSLRGGTLTAQVPFEIARGIHDLRSRFPCEWMLSSLDLLASRWSHDQCLSGYEADRLASHVYSRIPDFPPPFRLASLAPKASGLQYSPTLPQGLMENEPVLHVAYLINRGRWCFASWTDQWAQCMEVDMFRLENQTDRALQTVFLEIWQRTCALAKKIREHGNSRFCITKCGAMPLFEKEVWSKVIVQSYSVVLLDVPHPTGLWCRRGPHSVRPPIVREDKPVVDSVIVDYNDAAYGVSIGIPLPLVSGYVNAIAKGFLLRCDSAKALTLLEVRLLVMNEFKIPPRSLMNRVIGQFRRLASVAEYLGVCTRASVVPWHIAALTKLEGAALKLNM